MQKGYIPPFMGNFSYFYHIYEKLPIFTVKFSYMKDRVSGLINTHITGEKTDRLENDIIVIENPRTDGHVNYPLKSDTTISVIATEGSMECIADMTVHKIDVPGMLIILPSQIVESISFSKDFKGYCLIMSSSFMANLPMGNKIPLLANVRQNGFFPLDDKSLEAIKNYVRMVQTALRAPNNYKYEILTHLTVAYYYGLGTYIHNAADRDIRTSGYDRIANDFITLVRDNCHIRRDMGFYADSLCLSAKHVSLAVKKVTGDSAMKWIERYTILNAKSLLKTTDLNVSEISDRLGFPTPSDFGKYFRRFTGLSPRTFREK